MSTTFKPTINVPVRFAIQFADQVEGQYGPQLRLKGKPEASQEQVYVYLPVDCINALMENGATAKTTDKGTSYGPIKAGLWTILKAQAAGERYPVTTLTAPTNGKVEVPVVAKKEESGPGKPEATDAPSADARLVALYDDSLRHAIRIVKALNAGDDPVVVFTGTDVKEMAAALFIARSKLV